MEEKKGLRWDLRCTRREFLKKIGKLGIFSSAVGMGLIKPFQIMAAVSREINIGTFGPSHCAVPFVYTKLRGFFEEEKLNVNLINYAAMPLIAQDIINGKLDFGQLIVPLVFAMHTGVKPFTTKTPVVVTQITGTNGAALMIRKGSGITKPLDFKGKTMSNHSKLSVHYLINMMFLEAHGLDYLKDVNFKIIELGKIVKAMKDGEVDTFVMPEPKNAMVEYKGIGDVYMLSKYIWPSHPCCALVTRREFFEQDRELVTAVTRAMTKGGLSANKAATREETINILQGSPEYRYDKVPKVVLMNAFIPGRSDFYPFPYQSTARVIIEDMKKYGLLPKEVDDRQLSGEVFLSDLSRQVIRELGAKPPESDYREEKILGRIRVFSE